jgi:hypothetical protein
MNGIGEIEQAVGGRQRRHPVHIERSDLRRARLLEAIGRFELGPFVTRQIQRESRQNVEARESIAIRLEKAQELARQVAQIRGARRRLGEEPPDDLAKAIRADDLAKTLEAMLDVLGDS